VRHRKEKLFEVLQQYYRLMVNQKDFQFLISIDEDDEILNTTEVILQLMRYPHLQVEVGESKGKIYACNRDIDTTKFPWDIVVLVSDDMKPLVKGYDMHIRKGFKKHFPDFDGVLWFNDGHQKDRLNTLCILGKPYYERFGYIYHPDYVSLYCDNEFTEVAQRLGKIHYSPTVIIEHQHWAWGYGEMDGLYKKNEAPISQDQQTYLNRKANNFELK
jgi:hypothetical protein